MATAVQVRISGFAFVGIGFLLLATVQALAQPPPSPPPGWVANPAYPNGDGPPLTANYTLVLSGS